MVISWNGGGGHQTIQGCLPEYQPQSEVREQYRIGNSEIPDPKAFLPLPGSYSHSLAKPVCTLYTALLCRHNNFLHDLRILLLPSPVWSFIPRGYSSIPSLVNLVCDVQFPKLPGHSPQENRSTTKEGNTKQKQIASTMNTEGMQISFKRQGVTSWVQQDNYHLQVWQAFPRMLHSSPSCHDVTQGSRQLAAHR